jgi:indole-3-glycerol phosphate synthase
MTAATGTYLDRIVADVRARLAEPITSHGLGKLPRRSLAGSIAAARTRGELAVIGEVKRRSPSVGAIDEQVDPVAQAGAYAGAGAAAISVLTEPDHFAGTIDDLVAVRHHVDVPVLRKDFIIDGSQLDAAHDAGADSVLLIAALLADRAMAMLVAHAHELDMEVLLEVHDERELERALATDADVIGINNRNLSSFLVDLTTSERLAAVAADDPRPLVAESGIRTPRDAARMQAAGVDALLVGEALMRAPQPGGLLRELATARGQGASR